MSELILYTTEDGKSQIQLRANDGTVWLSQRQMAELFDVSLDNISLHLKNIYQDAELSREATTEESSVVQPEGEREVRCEMLARIRDIRASEKRFYQKVRDLFVLSSDYDKTDKSTQQFFAMVQNLLLYAVTQQTAAELICARANPKT